MLFARFLAETGFLLDPEMGIAITLEECEELARDGGEGMWVYASRCGPDMLPQIFRSDDPLLQIAFAPSHHFGSEGLLNGFMVETVTATDTIGWTYQFWQTKKD